MAEDSQEKQHAASSKRIADLRKKGRVMRSKDLVGGLVIILGVIVLTQFSTKFKTRIEDNFTLAFDAVKNVLSYHDDFAGVISSLVMPNFWLVLPVLIMMLAAVMASPFLFGGWNFSLESVQFNFGKLNPVTNLGNIFSPKRMAGELFKSILKSSVIIMALVYFVWTRRNEILTLLNYSPKMAINASYVILESFVVLLCSCVIFLILFDVMYHFFEFQSQVKMSTQELKDEHKESDGSPEVKQKIRSRQVALLRQRLSQTVPRATVILVNPTHYAVALRYDKKKDHAPKVLAKGKGAIAQQIRNIASSNAIPIYEAPSLTRAVYYTTKIGYEIHPSLYMAVAIVLSYVHQLKNYQLGIGQQPQHVSNFELPEEFIYNE